MSGPQQLDRVSPPGAWPMYRSMVGIGVLCGVLIVTVFQWTRPVIERNRAEALQRAIFRVLPGARSSATFRLTADEGFEVFDGVPAGGELVHAGYDDNRRLVGLAVEAAGMGYQDVIRLLYGYSPGNDAIVGLEVLESKETPGLGDKIENDPEFVANFKQLDVSLSDDRTALANPILLVPAGTKDQPWQVDAITGATISSTAVAGILGGSAAYWIPRLRRHVEDFTARDGDPKRGTAESEGDAG